MGKRARSGSASASAKKRRRYGVTPYKYRRYKPAYVRPGYGAIGRTPGGGVLGEMKYFDTAVSSKAVPNAATWVGSTIDPTTFNTLCVPVVGAAYNQRIGKEINIVKLKIRGQFIVPIDTTSGLGFTPVVVRYGIFQDMQTNSTQADGNLVMTPTSTSAQSPFTFQNIDNFGRFKVLKDKTGVIQDPNMAGSDTAHDVNGKTHLFKMTIKFRKPIQVRFNQTNGGTVADIIDNSLHFFAQSNSGLANVNYLCRVCYKE
jgi:hypothetical protein